MTVALRNHVEPLDPTDFEEDQPVRASKAWSVVRSLDHLVRQSPQTYCNWAGKPSTSGGSHILLPSTSLQRTFHHPFRAVWTRADRPSNMNLVVMARTATAIANITARARVVADIGAVGDTSLPALIDESAAVASATATAVIDISAYFDAVPQMAASWRAIPILQDGQIVIAAVSMLRLELTLSADAADPDIAEICGVALWGFS